ncbi:cobalamin B12-binding domain-containing protein [Pararhizobium mangrovi]|uniref:Cobalamin B12-binding domain-containing protein n=2 Tax=Pararhizobium mangrovi TaxID=2590452 RepID=A0A506UF61_9HYPH|nr:cobalamin B12-binding domain-containing protein [Pararhizobium mangrovi]
MPHIAHELQVERAVRAQPVYPPSEDDFRNALRGVVRDKVAGELRKRHSAVERQATQSRADEDFGTFLHLLLEGRRDDLAKFAAASGSAKHVCQAFLTPAARCIGDLWVADRLSFVDVTHKTAMLQRLMRERFMAEADDACLPLDSADRSILLAAADDEQHTFGLAMVAEHFWAAGWEVELANRGDLKEAGKLAASRPFSLIGLSVGHRRHLDELSDKVAFLRRSSCDESSCLMLGGPAFQDESPRRVERYGADIVCQDAAHAVASGESFISTKSLGRSSTS